MPNFKKVLWRSAIEKTYDPRKRAKLAGEFETEVFGAAIEAAESNHELWQEHVLKVKNSGKVMLDGIEKAVEEIKNGSDGDERLKEVERVHGQLVKLAEDLRVVNEEYASLFSADGFRENSLIDPITKIDKTAVLEANVLDRLIKSIKARREKLIVADRVLVAERARVGEYVERAAAILKAAQTIASGEKLERSTFKKEFEKISAAFDGDHGIDRTIVKLREKLREAYAAAKNGPRDLADQKLSVGKIEYPAVRKTLSGDAKTAVLKLQALKATYGSKLWSKLAISGMEKRLMLAIDEIKKLGASVDLFERDMTKLILENLGEKK